MITFINVDAVGTGYLGNYFIGQNNSDKSN